MKKIYMTPEMEIVEMKAQQLLAFSGDASDNLIVDPNPDDLVDDNLAPLLGDPLSFFLQ